jgi:hypothetical protein
VVSESRSHPFEAQSPDHRLQALQREAALALAQESRKKDDVQSYQKHIKSFIRLSNDPSKLLSARADFFHLLTEKKDWDGLSRELLALSPGERNAKEFESFRILCWRAAILRGDFQMAAQFLPQGSNRPLFAWITDTISFFVFGSLR